MCISKTWRRRTACATLTVLLLAAAPVVGAEQAQEIAARSLLGEAEKLMELALPQDALPILDRVQSDHPDTEAAAFAQLRRAQCFMYLRRLDEAISTARAVVTSHPNTVLAAWAQCCVGESLVKARKPDEGVRELLRVGGMLPDRRDLGPLNMARGIIGRVCVKRLADSSDPLDVMEFLGLSRSDAKARAMVLATIAVYRSKQGRPDLANPIADRLAAECPDEVSELIWARSEIARRMVGRDWEHNADGVWFLSSICASSSGGDDAAAKAHLWLARFYKRKGQLSQAVTVLRDARDRFPGISAEMLYDLGNLLYRQGEFQEARAVLMQIVDGMPLSGYAAPALYCIGANSGSDRAAALESLTRLADGNYDARWRGLALWRLGDLYKSADKTRARDCYSRAVEIFQSRLVEQKADLGEDWQDMLRSRIALIQSEIDCLGAER